MNSSMMILLILINKLFYTKEQEPSITFIQTRVFLLSSVKSVFGYKVSNVLLNKIVWRDF